jgi:uncharacterized glyoxalase superfamily protein PhnB
MPDSRPAKLQWLTPYLIVKDAERSSDFYVRAFDFKVGRVLKKFGVLIHIEMEHHDEVVLMFSPEGTFGTPEKSPRAMGVMASQVFYLYVDDVDATYQKSLQAGAQSLAEPCNMFWGDRFAMVEDPDGYRWALARHFSFAA